MNNMLTKGIYRGDRYEESRREKVSAYSKKQRSASCIDEAGTNIVTELKKGIDSKSNSLCRHVKPEVLFSVTPKSLKEFCQGRRNSTLDPQKVNASFFSRSNNSKINSLIPIYLHLDGSAKKIARKSLNLSLKPSYLKDKKRYSVLLQHQITELESEISAHISEAELSKSMADKI